MADTKRPRPSAEQLAEIKAAYEGGASQVELEKRFGYTRKTIRAWARRYGWLFTPPSTHLGTTEAVAVAKRAQAQVIDLATRKVVEIAVESGVVDKVAETVAGEVTKYVEIESLLLDVAADTLKKITGKKFDEHGRVVTLRAGTHTSEAGEIKDATTAAALALDKSRELRGKRVGDASIKPEGDDPEAVDLVKFTIVDGRANGTTGTT